ncbi:hypothetical protein KIN20_013786 [Parelaphostrongylus tenuis]|uniref:Uncharacterized protein n=1 Tax=Parelaphostrongylus tenuis TaxID=148309 RepID=A0AAD5MHB5_PARTN|nr:hypothetical protein KIN20_013786 [Parelaphostrongylus tenuis]
MSQDSFFSEDCLRTFVVDEHMCTLLPNGLELGKRVVEVYVEGSLNNYLTVLCNPPKAD